MSVLKFDVVGMGANKGDQEEAALNLKVVKVLKDLKITVELRGMIETRWSGDKPQVPGDILPVRFAKRFLHLSEVVRDKKEPLHPNEASVTAIGEMESSSIIWYDHLTFKMELPSNGLPPTIHEADENHKELEVPVIVRMPESTRLHLLNSPSPIEHNPLLHPTNAATLSIYLYELFNQATLSKLMLEFFRLLRTASFVPLAPPPSLSQNPSPRPPKSSEDPSQITHGATCLPPSRSILWRSTLRALSSPSSPTFYLEIFLKGSDVANIAVEVPIVLVPAARNDPEKSMTTPSLKSRGSISSEPGMTNSPSAYTPNPTFQAFNLPPSQA
ncbi:hypothetical protein BC829DRAFT_431606 [Chytridium lagenaria]|nr:hypothetical protein BC829DRAFT_431606 [Chytridium lagenaria]